MVCRERLRRGAEVEHDAGGHPHRARALVDLDNAPPGGADRAQRPRRGPDGVEVAVVAGEDQRPADRRVDVTIGQARRAQRREDGLDQERTDNDGAATGGVDAGDLAVVTKAAARAVDRVELALDGRAGRRQRRLAVDEQDGCRSQRPPGRARAHDPPELAGGACCSGCGCGCGCGAGCGACWGGCSP